MFLQDMSKTTKRKHVTSEVINDYVLPENGLQIVKVIVKINFFICCSLLYMYMYNLHMMSALGICSGFSVALKYVGHLCQ